MECLLCPTLEGLHFGRFYDVFHVIGLHVVFCAAVSPNSPEKNVPLPCSVYKFAIIDENGDTKCRRCSMCPKGFQVQTECSTFNDTVCEQCSSGWYNDVSGSRCKQCSGCKPGEYIRRDCSVTRNMSCRQCPRDMMSANENASRCVPCKTCRRNEKILSKCNGSEDTTCGECQKQYFRESSTGNCLLCSHCPPVLQNSVVPECRDKYGIHHPDICWPSDTQERFPNFNKNSSSNDDVTRGDIEITEETPKETIPLSFVVAVVGTLLGCAIVVVSAFICTRQLLPSRYSNLNQPVHRDTGISSTPMSRVYVKDDVRFGSVPVRHSELECTYFPSGVDMDGNESIEDTIPLKSFDSSINHDKDYFGDTTPRTWSAPEISKTTFTTVFNSFRETSRVNRQICENSKPLHNKSLFPGDKIHGTL